MSWFPGMGMDIDYGAYEGYDDVYLNAESEFAGSEEAVLQISGKVQPNPRFHARSNALIEGIGIYSGTWRITKVMHSWSKSGYAVSFSGEKNAEGVTAADKSLSASTKTPAKLNAEDGGHKAPQEMEYQGGRQWEKATGLMSGGKSGGKGAKGTW